MTSCASVSERIYSSSSNCFEIGSFSLFFKNINCVLCRNRHSSGKTPAAHLIVRMSSSRKKRLLWPAPAKGDHGIEVFLPFTSRTSGTHRRQFDFRQRSDTCSVAALLPHCAPRCCVPSTTLTNSRRLGTLCTGATSANTRAPWDVGGSGLSTGIDALQGVPAAPSCFVTKLFSIIFQADSAARICFSRDQPTSHTCPPACQPISRYLLLLLINACKYHEPRIRVNGATPVAVRNSASRPRHIALWPFLTSDWN